MLLRSFKGLSSLGAGFLVLFLGLGSVVSASPFGGVGEKSFVGLHEPMLLKARGVPLSRQARQSLSEKGYTNIVVKARELAENTILACRGRKLFRIVIHDRGNILRREHLGACPPAVRRPVPRAVPRPRTVPRHPEPVWLSLPQVRRRLQDRGFSEIRFLDRELPIYVATACKNYVRYRLRINRWAIINGKVRIGRCGVEPTRPRVPRDRPDEPEDLRRKSPSEVRQILRNRGFRRINFIDRRLPVYVVRACKHNRRMELRIDRTGWIIGRTRLGRCEERRRGMSPPQVRRVLQTRGFSRIIFIDHELPVYVAEACRHDRKFELRLNRFARIMRRTDIGSCRVARTERGFKPHEVRNRLRLRGYREIEFFDRHLPGYGVIACKRGQKFRMRINRFAEVRKRRRIGFCRPPVSAPPPADDYQYIDEEEIRGTGRIDPETCQTYLDALVHRNRIHFDVASATLRRGSFGLLRRLARVMDRCPSSRIEISGHTDSDGSREYNRDLSRRRASSVVRFLSRQGISMRRMTAFGYGEDQPLMRYERTERDKARNRRIEFTVIWGDDNEDDYMDTRR